MLILQSAGDDLRRTCGTAIDQHDKRQTVGQIAWRRLIALCVSRIAPARGHDFPALQEGIRHGDALVQKAARIVAQIEHVAQQFIPAFFAQIGDRAFQTRLCLAGEAGDPNVSDIGFQSAADGLDLDSIPRDRHIEGLGYAGTKDGQRDVFSDFAAHDFNSLIKSLALHRVAIQMRDQITSFDTGTRRRGFVDRGDNAHIAAFVQANLNPKTAEFAARLCLHGTERLFIHIGGVWVQTVHHSADSGFDQFLVADFFDIVVTDAPEDLPKEVEEFECVGSARRVLGVSVPLTRKHGE